ncbi:hypothetical protein DMENIID0001_046050 [Sergentomyia squamirostris]
MNEKNWIFIGSLTLPFWVVLSALVVVVVAKPSPQDFRTPDYYDYQSEPKVHPVEVKEPQFARSPEIHRGTFNYPNYPTSFPTRSTTPVETITRKPVVEVTHYDSESDDTHYTFSFETEDGQKRKEEGTVLYPHTDEETVHVTGYYSYVNNGVLYEVSYTADSNGFHPHVKKTPLHHV